MASPAHSRKKVSYYYDSHYGDYYYGKSHPMKPLRVRVANALIMGYGLSQKMEMNQPPKISFERMTTFHDPAYIRFLQAAQVENSAFYQTQMEKFNVGVSCCPLFKGLYKFCQTSAGGSVAGAIKLNRQEADIAVNWGGGHHQAKKGEASGGYYVNDAVLAILELLKYHQRVLYLDIDVHHGDGVEEAFYQSDRVMTISFHEYAGMYFPGTGSIRDTGEGKGQYYSVNVPLMDGIDDESYESVFVTIVAKAIDSFQPSAIVLQSGAGSLAADPIGNFNLSIEGHGKCVEFLRKYNIPLLLLGGGGYDVRNVARCWTYETGLAVGVELNDELPDNEYFEYFAPNQNLHILPSEIRNQNTQEYIDKTITRVLENLRMLSCAPGVQLQDIPEDGLSVDEDEEEERDNENPDQRISQRAREKRVAKDSEYSDSEDEGDGRRDEKSFKRTKRPRTDDYESPNEMEKSDADDDGNAAKPKTDQKDASATNAEDGEKMEESPKKFETLPDMTVYSVVKMEVAAEPPVRDQDGKGSSAEQDPVAETKRTSLFERCCLQ